MKNVIETLEKYYQSFKNEKEDRDFFLGLADYVKYIKTTSETKEIITLLSKDKTEDVKKIKQSIKEAREEMEEVKNKLFRRIKQKKISFNDLDKALQRYQDYKNGKLFNYYPKLVEQRNELTIIIKVLWENNYKEIIKDLVDQDKNPSNVRFCTCFKKLEQCWKYFNELIKFREWWAWDELALVYIATFKPKKEMEKYKREWNEWRHNLEFSTKNLAFLKKEIGRMNFCSNHSIYYKPEIFRKNNYTSYLNRVHTYLIQELNKKEECKKPKEQFKQDEILRTFIEIQVKDKYIWVNNYLLSKPHIAGSNSEFFEYVRAQPANTKIERDKLPDYGDLALKQQVKNKSFIKILNELGFKGEILKAFFPKRGKDMLIYRGDKINKKDLEKTGIKIQLFLKELELAHLKNSPE